MDVLARTVVRSFLQNWGKVKKKKKNASGSVISGDRSVTGVLDGFYCTPLRGLLQVIHDALAQIQARNPLMIHITAFVIHGINMD